MTALGSCVCWAIATLGQKKKLPHSCSSRIDGDKIYRWLSAKFSMTNRMKILATVERGLFLTTERVFSR